MKFKDRYVLATGYPWSEKCYDDIKVTYRFNITDAPTSPNYIKPRAPADFRTDGEVTGKGFPRYRLVLERVKQKGKKV